MSEDNLIKAYLKAVNCFEQLEEDIVDNPETQLFNVLEGLYKCRQELSKIIDLETATTIFPVTLFQLKNQINILIENVIGNETAAQTKEIKQKNNKENNYFKKRFLNENDIGPTTKKSRNRNDEDEKFLGIIESITVVPRSKGFSDVAGMQYVKKTLKTLVILPKTQPQLFKNRFTFNTILLFGPPGTGKTQLVHALAAETKATFYSISLSDILSKYIGETERTLKSIFQHIKKREDFSIIFIDEVDGFCKKRNEGEQEYSRRMKTQFMCQLSELEQSKNFIIICATNCPWDLDNAILRRFQKRIYVSLPDRLERLEILKLLMEDLNFESPINWDDILNNTNGYSCADLVHVVQNAEHIPLIELDGNISWKINHDGFYEPADLTLNQNIILSELADLPENSVKARMVTIDDLLKATEEVKPTVSDNDIKKFELFNNNK